MKTNFKKIVIVLVIIAIIAGVITYFINKNKKPEYVEYEPQEEISDEQERKTMISLYFVNKTTRNVEPEARMLDVKTLIKDPYTVIINMLIDGPKNGNHDNVIPEGTTLTIPDKAKFTNINRNKFRRRYSKNKFFIRICRKSYWRKRRRTKDYRMLSEFAYRINRSKFHKNINKWRRECKI